MPGQHSRSRTAKASATRKSRANKEVPGEFEGGVAHLISPEPPHSRPETPSDGEAGGASAANQDHPTPTPDAPADGTGGPGVPLLGKFSLDLAAPPPAVEQVAESGDYRDVDGDPKKLTKAQRRVEALNLRAAGHNYRVIADTLGVSVKTAYMDVQDGMRYLSAYERVIAEDHRAMDLTRLDLMLSYLWSKVELGDTFAMQTALQVMARRSKLLGLDAPVEIDLNVRRPLKEASLTELVELAKKLQDHTRALPDRSHSLSTPTPLLANTDSGGREEDWEEKDGSEVDGGGAEK